MLEMFVTKTHFDTTSMQKNNKNFSFHYTAMPTIVSQILKFAHISRLQKSKYLDSETLISLKIKINSSGNLYGKNSLLSKICAAIVQGIPRIQDNAISTL